MHGGRIRGIFECQINAKITPNSTNMQKRNSLIINQNSSLQEPALMAIIRDRDFNSLKTRKFVFSKALSAKLMPKRENTYFKKVRLVDSAQGWYISYYFRIPADLLQHIPVEKTNPEWFNAKGGLRKWARFRYKGSDLNRIGTPEYREQELKGVRALLEDGYDPFQSMIDDFNDWTGEAEKKQIISLNFATDAFLSGYKNEGSKGQYRTMVNFLKEYFTSTPEVVTDLWYQSVQSFRTEDLREFMDEYKEERDWAANTYNDKVDKLITIFQYCVDKRYITENPAKYLVKETKGTIKKHKYYTDDFAPVVQKAMLAVPYWGLYLHRFCEVIFFTFTRPKKETRLLKIEDILWDRHAFNIPNERAKGGYGGTIQMGPEMEALFLKMGLKDLPPHYYIFGKDGPPGPEPTIPKFFDELFRVEVREPNGFDENYTNYGWKHRRCVKLFLGGATVAFIQQQCRHQDPTTTEKYLRALGMEVGTIGSSVEVKF